MSKRSRRVPKKITNIILTIFICANLFMTEPLAESATAGHEYSEEFNMNQSVLTEIKEEDIDYELVEKREEFSRHFKLKDGRIVACQYESEVAVRNNTGKYELINNQIDFKNNYFINESNDAVVTFNKDNHFLSFSDGNITLTVDLIDSKRDMPKYFDIEGHDSKLANLAVSGVILYENVYDNIDAMYQLVGNSIKESLILKDFGVQTDFYYEISAEGYSLFKGDNYVELKNENNSYYFSAPFALDNNGVSCNNIALDIVDENTIVVSIDKEWLNDENRSFPVIVDPTIKKTLSGSAVGSTSVCTYRPDSNYMNQYGALYVGREASEYEKCRGALKFGLPTIDESNTIVSASISLYQMGFRGNGDNYIKIAPITADLPLSTLTWNKLDGNIGKFNDYIKTDNWTKDKRFSFDITQIVTEWYKNDNNYGLVLVCDSENDVYRYTTFTSSAHPSYIGQHPFAMITYLSNDGLENYLTYQDVKTETMGEFYVGHFNGNLIYLIDDFRDSGNYLPVNIVHVYNHNQRRQQISDSNMKFGLGFRLNVSMQIKYHSDYNYYTLIDEDGTTHYYYQDSSDSSLYHREFSTTETLRIGENDYIVEKDGYNIYFSKGNGMLREVHNLINNKKQIYNYNQSNQLISITDGAERITCFNYDSNNYLVGIVYDANKTINYSYNDQGQLIQIVFNDQKIINYQYGNDYELIRISNLNEGSIDIEYLSNNPKRVKKITVNGKDDSEYQSCGFDYSYYQSKITYNDGYSLKYEFDNNGHTICISDDEGKAKYYGYGNSDDSNMHSLKVKSDMQSRNVNLIKNSKPYGTEEYTGEFAYNDVGYFELKNYIQQVVDVSGQSGDTYTLSFDMRGQKAKIYINNQVYQIENSDKSAFKHFSYTYLADKPFDKITVKIENISDLNSTGGGEIMTIGAERLDVYVKNIKLEEGSVGNRISLLENGNFNNGIKYWSVENSSNSDKIVNDGFKLVGDLYNEKNIYQIVEQKGSVADRIIINGFVKSDCAVITPLNDNIYARNIGIKVELLDASNKVLQKEIFNCLALTNDQQFVSGCLTSTVNYSKIKVVMICNYQIGTVIFDDIALYVDNFGSKYDYDDKGRVIFQQDSTGNIIETYYKSITARGKNIDVIDCQTYKRVDDADYEQKIEFVYNEWGLKAKETLTNYNVGENEVGRIITTEYHYDEKGNLLYTVVNGQKKYESGKIDYGENYVDNYIDEKGNTISFTYDDYGKILSLTDGNNNQTSFIYDNYGQVSSMTKGDNTINYTYNALGQILTVNRGNQVYSFEYDNYNRQKNIKLDGITMIEYQYDSNGNILQKKRNGNVEEYEYDQLDRLTAVKEGNECISEYYYGNDGKLGLVKDYLSDETIRYSYDAGGNLLIEDHSNGLNIVNGYDEKKRTNSTEVTYNEISQKIEYFYNGLEEIDKIKYQTNDKEAVIEYFKDDLLRISKNKYTVSNNTVLTTSFAYLDMQEEKTTNIIKEFKNEYGQNEDSYQYDYDGAGNIISLTVKRNNDVYHINYQYDERYRLIRENNELIGKTIIYCYDIYDNITSKKIYIYSTFDDLTELNPIEEYAYSYDENEKNLLVAVNGQSIIYNSSKDPTQYYDGTQFTWDNGRLASFTNENYSGQYSYNSDGIRVKKKVTNKSNLIGSSSENIEFKVSGGKILVEKRGDRLNTSYITYDYDSNGNLLGFVHSKTEISLIVGKKETLESNRYFYLKNSTGDIVGIVDEAGNLKAEYKYDAYGNCTVTNCDSDNIGNLNPFRYKSYYYDQETGLYYLNSRYYDPQTGRFISPDNIENVNFKSAEINLYAYCRNNPIMYEDSQGEKSSRLLNILAALITKIIIHLLFLNYNANTINEVFSEQIRDSAIEDGLETVFKESSESALLIKYIVFTIIEMSDLFKCGFWGCLVGIAIVSTLSYLNFLPLIIDKYAETIFGGVIISIMTTIMLTPLEICLPNTANGLINNDEKEKTPKKIARDRKSNKFRKIFFGGY